MFIKENRDGTIKCRKMAGGNKKMEFISKEDSSSPTVTTKAMLLSCIIDAEEEREVYIIDTPNAFIQTQVDNKNEMAVIKIIGVLVDLIPDIDPQFYGNVVTKDKKSEKVLIVQCLNAIYRTMVASLLYYNKFVKTLKMTVFKLKPYDHCVANHLVNNNQQTI